MAGPDAQRDAKYKPAEVCRLADVQPYVLRYWESEFPFLVPNRNVSGPRSYTEHDLQLIRRIKKLLYDEGYTIAGAKKRLETELKKGVPLFDDTELAEVEPTDAAEAETAVAPFDPDDTGAGSPAAPKPKRKQKAPPPPPPPGPGDIAVDVEAPEAGELVFAPPARPKPPIPPVPPVPTAIVRSEKHSRVVEAVTELKEILAILSS